MKNSQQQVNESFANYKANRNVNKAFREWNESLVTRFTDRDVKNFARFYAQRVTGGKI